MRVSNVPLGAGDDSHSLVIASCGYERRSSYICRLQIRGDEMLTLNYDGESGSFSENKADFERLGWTLATLDDAIAAIDRLGTSGSDRSVLVDISSMPRSVLARLIQVFVEAPDDYDVTFVYAPGDFEQSARAAGRHEILTAEPISPFFAGELRPTSLPVGLVVGLGLEQYRALGVMELLEPAHTWIFTTYSGDERYKGAAEKVHSRLLETFDPGSVFEYDIRSIADTFASLESLSFSAGLRYRLIMAPSGPKVFSLACLLVGASRDPARPAVWRVGGAGQPQAFDVEEAGDLVAAKASFVKLVVSDLE